MTEPIISFKDVSFQYHSQAEPTLNKVSLDIYPGEKVLIVGASGSGKSTFINCINGLIPFKYKGELSGSICINQKDANNYTFNERSNYVGTVLQDTDGQFIGMTAAEDMAFILENNKVSRIQMHSSVSYWAKKVQIKDHLYKKPQELSGGQKQRVSLGGNLIHKTPILIFDEPLANLDPATGQETMALIEDIHKETKSTIIMVEHRLDEALNNTFDRVILFEEGIVVADTTPDCLLRTTKLRDSGIREPLYVSAIKYANVSLNELHNLADVNQTLSNPNVKNAISKWYYKTKTALKSSRKQTLLELKGISYKYSKNTPEILNDISLKFNSKEMIGIVGHNGAGKSTLAKAICGFIKYEGSMNWLNKSFDQLSIKERSEYVGYVMQNPNHMISEKMIYDEVALGLRLRGVTEIDIEKKVKETLEICGLYVYRNWPIAALSYGQKKRVTIASILVLSPKIIILYEPTAGQDFKHYTEMMDFLSQLNQQGMTIIMITHDMHLLTEYTNRTIMLSEGQVIADIPSIEALTKSELCRKAALRKTTLYQVAENTDVIPSKDFIEFFIDYDKEVRKQ